MVKLGREEPAMSMDVGGKIVWAKHSEMQQANLKAMGPDADIKVKYLTFQVDTKGPFSFSGKKAQKVRLKAKSH